MINRLLHCLTSDVKFDYDFLNETNAVTNKTTLTYILDEDNTLSDTLTYLNYFKTNNLIPYVLCLLHNLPDIESLISDDFKQKTYTANSFNLMSLALTITPDDILTTLDSLNDYSIKKWLTLHAPSFNSLYLNETISYRKLAIFIVALISTVTLKQHE